MSGALRRCLAVLCAVLLLLLLIPSVRAAEAAEDVLGDLVDGDALEEAGRDSGGSAAFGESLEEGIGRILEAGRELLPSLIREAARSGVLLLVILLFCGIAETVQDASGSPMPAVPLAGVLATAAVSVSDIHAMVSMGRDVVSDMRRFADVLLPASAAVTAATGAVTGAALRQMAAVLCSDLLLDLMDGLLVPLVYGYITAAVAWAAAGNEGLNRMAEFLKWAATAILTIIATGYVGYLTAASGIAGAADAAAVKATRFAISGAIPVVGGILSDAAETVLASAGVLQGTVGVFGMVTVLSICTVPVLSLFLHYLAYRLAETLAAAAHPGRVADLAGKLSNAFALMLGITGLSALLLLAALVSAITAISV